MPDADDRMPDDVDPTGIRDLLAGLPDPGPMPEGLVRRIEARLEVEQAARSQGDQRTLDRHGERVVDLAVERSRRRPGRALAVLGAAAVGLVATAMAVPQLLGGQDGADVGTAAHYPTRDRADTLEDAEAGAAAEDAPLNTLSSAGDQDDAAEDGGVGGDADAGGGDGGADAGGGDDAEAAEESTDLAAPDFVAPLGGELVLLPELGPLQEQDLTLTVRMAVGEFDRGAAQPGQVRGALTEGEAVSCWRGLPTEHTFDRYVAARADLVALDGGQQEREPVVALLGLDDDGDARSWLLPESCTEDEGVVPLVEGVPDD